jgi:hypothetical protein
MTRPWQRYRAMRDVPFFEVFFWCNVLIALLIGVPYIHANVAMAFIESPETPKDPIIKYVLPTIAVLLTVADAFPGFFSKLVEHRSGAQSRLLLIIVKDWGSFLILMGFSFWRLSIVPLLMLPVFFSLWAVFQGLPSLLQLEPLLVFDLSWFLQVALFPLFFLLLMPIGGVLAYILLLPFSVLVGMINYGCVKCISASKIEDIHTRITQKTSS